MNAEPFVHGLAEYVRTGTLAPYLIEGGHPVRLQTEGDVHGE